MIQPEERVCSLRARRLLTPCVLNPCAVDSALDSAFPDKVSLQGCASVKMANC